MSVQISKKKQVIFGIIVLVIILGLVEAAANIWWNNFHKCTFETSEIYDHLDDESKKQLCLQFQNLEHLDTWIVPIPGTKNTDDLLVKINSHGLRGPEFTKDKPTETFRIFLVGGSTTFSPGVSETETISYHLQEKFSSIDLGLNVEVINAGIGRNWALQEIDLIKQRLINFEPDLFIIYDGWNEIQIVSLPTAEELGANPETWKQRWSEICNLGKQHNFETIVALQPYLGTGKKYLSDQELVNYKARISLREQDLKNYDMYAEQLPELRQLCANAVDLRGIFDDITESIYYDQGHVGNKGNKIIAEKFFDLALPIILENSKLINNEVSVEIVQHDNDEVIDKMPSKSSSTFSFYKTPSLIQYILSNPERLSFEVETLSKKNDYVGKNLDGDNFEGKDLKDAIFNYAIINDVDFSNADLSGANFRSTEIQNANFKGANMVGATFARANITSSEFSNADLTDSNFSGVEIENSAFSNTVFTNSDLRGSSIRSSNFENTNFVNADFTHSFISAVDFTKTDLSNSKLNGVFFITVNLASKDLSSVSLNGTNAQPTILVDVNLNHANLSGSSMHNVDLTSKYFPNIDIFYVGASLRHADLTDMDLSVTLFNTFTGEPNHEFSKLVSPDLTNANLSGSNFSGNNLSYVNFVNADLSNTDLSSTIIIHANLTGANLSAANLSGANLEFTNMNNVILDGAILDCLNHPICN